MTPETPTLPASTVADLAICVRDIFAAIGEDATVLFGKRHVTQEGAPRRVVFVPDTRGKWSKDYTVGGAGKGYTAATALGCWVYIWGAPAPDGDDFESTRDADALLALVINALCRPSGGVLDGDQVGDAGQPEDDAYGFAYKLRFVLNQGVEKDARVWSLKNTSSDPVSPPDPQRPPGTSSATDVESDVSSTVA